MAGPTKGAVGSSAVGSSSVSKSTPTPAPAPTPTPASSAKPTSSPKSKKPSSSSGAPRLTKKMPVSGQARSPRVSVKKNQDFSWKIFSLVSMAAVIFLLGLTVGLTVMFCSLKKENKISQPNQNQVGNQNQELLSDLQNQVQTLKQELAQARQNNSFSSFPTDPIEPAPSLNVSTTPALTRDSTGNVAPSELKDFPSSISSETVTTEEAVVFTREFFGSSGMPSPPKYESEEERQQSRIEEEWLVAKMCSQAPAPQRVEAAQKLGDYPYYRVARVLSFVVTSDHFAEVRAAAAESLGKVGNVEFIPLLDKVIKKDPSSKVREAAQKAIEQIKARTANLPSGV